MPVKAISPKRKLNSVLDKISQAKERREELHENYLLADSDEEEQVVRAAVHSLDELLERYFLQAWQAYRELEDWRMDREISAGDELEKIDVYKGFDKKRRIVYCDGELHFVLTDSVKQGKVKYAYGYFCNC